MEKKVIRYSLILGGIGSIIVGLIFQSLSIFISVWVGIFTGLFGFKMIVSMVHSLETSAENGQKIGQSGYLRRYIFYGIVFVIASFLDLSVLAILFGIICHKASLLLYTYREKEDLHE